MRSFIDFFMRSQFHKYMNLNNKIFRWFSPELIYHIRLLLLVEFVCKSVIYRHQDDLWSILSLIVTHASVVKYLFGYYLSSLLKYIVRYSISWRTGISSDKLKYWLDLIQRYLQIMRIHRLSRFKEIRIEKKTPFKLRHEMTFHSMTQVFWWNSLTLKLQK